MNVLFCLINFESREGMPEDKFMIWLLLPGSAKYISKLSITPGPMVIGTNARVVLFFRINFNQVVDFEYLSTGRGDPIGWKPVLFTMSFILYVPDGSSSSKKY